MKQSIPVESWDENGRATPITRRFFCSGLLASLVLADTGCVAKNKEYPVYRYRLTVEVDTPEGMKAGSSVIEIRTFKSGSQNLTNANGTVMISSGEAVRVDLGSRGSIYALLRSDDMTSWAHYAMLLSLPSPYYELAMDNEKRSDLFNKLLGKQFVVPRRFRPNGAIANPTGYPTLIRFRDEQDSSTIEELDPENLSPQLGQGVKLRKISIELTRDPVTFEIRKHLTWLRPNSTAPMNPNHDPRDHSVSSDVHQFDFISINA